MEEGETAANIPAMSRPSQLGGLAMKRMFCIAAAFALFASPALAGDGQISNAALARLGLGGMRPMSDSQGLAVRGQFAIAGSFSYVSGGTTYTLINQPVGQHFAISATIAISSGKIAGGGAFATSH